MHTPEATSIPDWMATIPLMLSEPSQSIQCNHAVRKLQQFPSSADWYCTLPSLFPFYMNILIVRWPGSVKMRFAFHIELGYAIVHLDIPYFAIQGYMVYVCGDRTALCGHRSACAVTEPPCAVTDPRVRSPNGPVRSPNGPVRSPNRPVRSPIGVCGHRTALCGHRTALCGHRSACAVTERPCAVTEPPCAVTDQRVRSPIGVCGHRTALCGHRTHGIEAFNPDTCLASW